MNVAAIRVRGDPVDGECSESAFVNELPGMVIAAAQPNHVRVDKSEDSHVMPEEPAGRAAAPRTPLWDGHWPRRSWTLIVVTPNPTMTITLRRACPNQAAMEFRARCGAHARAQVGIQRGCGWVGLRRGRGGSARLAASHQTPRLGVADCNCQQGRLAKKDYFKWTFVVVFYVRF